MSSGNSNSNKQYIFHNPETYDHEESLAWRGRCILSHIGAPGEHGKTFRQAVEKLESLYSDDTEDSHLVEDRWTRLFGQIKEGSDLEELLQQERATYHEEQGSSNQLRSLIDHRERFEQMEQERMEKEEMEKEEEKKKKALARKEEKRRMFCAVCNKPATKQCSRCKSTFYCSAEHQRSDWKRHKKESCKDPELSEFFNGLSIMRGRSECQKYNDDGMKELTDEEYDMVAFPCPKITIFPFVSLFGPYHQKETTFKAPGGKKFFSVRDLARTLAEFELQGFPPMARTTHSEQLFGNHVYFEGFEKMKGKKDGEVSYSPLYGS